MLGSLAPIDNIISALSVIGPLVYITAMDVVSDALQACHDKQIKKRIEHVDSLYENVDLSELTDFKKKVARAIEDVMSTLLLFDHHV